MAPNNASQNGTHPTAHAKLLQHQGANPLGERRLPRGRFRHQFHGLRPAKLQGPQLRSRNAAILFAMGAEYREQAAMKLVWKTFFFSFLL